MSWLRKKNEQQKEVRQKLKPRVVPVKKMELLEEAVDSEFKKELEDVNSGRTKDKTR